jgi:hypothetical protein
MAIRKIRLGTNEDGTPLWHYEADGPVVFTGPITGTVELPDGTVVDVTEPFVEVADEAEALALSDAIGERHVAEGHPLFVQDPNMPSDGFVHTPSTQEG